MTPEDTADVVVAQYEKWVYPEPIEDLPAWLEGNWQWFDPSHAHRVLWPDRDYQPEMSILVAGCGANQAAVFAYNNPRAQVLAVDVSQPSLDHHEHLKAKHGLRNLDTLLLPIEEIPGLGRDFDLIVSTGVLHHLADPQAGMDALAQCLRPDGVAALMVYARYGRVGVEMLESVFRDLGLSQDSASVEIVKHALTSLPADHPVRSYLGIAPDLEFDAGVVDTFLHGRARSYTVDECLDLVASSGLDFQGWLHNSPYEPMRVPGNEFLAQVASLPKRERWSVMERINTRNACHFFMACHKDRPASQYDVDFTSSAVLDHRPEFRYRCGVVGDEVVRPGWRMSVTDKQRALLAGVDGQRSIRELIAPSEEAESLDFFRELWERDFLTLAMERQGGVDRASQL